MNKKNYLKKIALLILAITGVVLLNTCTQDVEDENQQSIIPYEPSSATLNIAFINASTGQPIGLDDGKSVTVSISGKDALFVTEISGIPSSTYKSDKGFMTLALIKNLIPSESNPIQININAVSDGFLPVHLALILTSAIHANYQIKMAEISNLPSGISNKVNNLGFVSNGSLASTVNIQTDPVGVSSTKAALSLPQNIILKDANGNKLNGTLKVSLTYFNNRDSSTADYFPGGGMMTTLNNNGVSSPSMLYSAGYVSINVTDASGKKAVTVENGEVNTYIEVPQGTYNPLTQSPAVAGDSVPMLSYDESSGKWNFEKNTVIVLLGGKLVINGSIKHFSYHNWDWWDGNSCYSGSHLKIKSASIQNGTPINFKLKVTRLSDGFEVGNSFNNFGGYCYTDTYDGSCEFILNRFCSSPVKITAINQINNQDIGSIVLTNPCQSGMNYDLFLNLGYQPPKDSIVLNVKAYCPSKPNIQIKPSLAYWYKDMSSTTSTWIPGWMIMGKTLLRLKTGHLYKFIVSFAGKSTIVSFTMGDPIYNNYTYDILLPPVFCQ